MYGLRAAFFVAVKASGNETDVEITTTINIDSIPFARMVTTRSAYRNYNAFANPGEALSTIFPVADFRGNCGEAVSGGCGEIPVTLRQTGNLTAEYADGRGGRING